MSGSSSTFRFPGPDFLLELEILFVELDDSADVPAVDIVEARPEDRVARSGPIALTSTSNSRLSSWERVS